MNVEKIMADMKSIKMQLEVIQKQEKAMFQEIALQLGILDDEPIMFMSNVNSMIIIWDEDFIFEINLNEGRNGYILRTRILENKITVLELDKIRRKQAKTIVNHMFRIGEDIEYLIQEKLEQKEMWKREREESAKEYKEKIREEVIAELQNEQKATKKAPAKKRARKSTKKTEIKEKAPRVPKAPEVPKTPTDILNDPFPDF
ncbi:hypothetical protein [Bacillus mycoides]|uniref:hypothetical protein n=1 Tax=Bacillus mycoides TaxID=1405 RepID=UPI000A27B6A8|nr:hypothetical protein [Bacillus mycoides]OSY03799.1 hypothetical protein BTJ44_05123 [Bacillus mycoides]